MNDLTIQNNQVQITGLDDMNDLSEISVIDSSGLVSFVPSNKISLSGKMFRFQLADGTEVDGGTELDAVILNVSPHQYRLLYSKPHSDPDSSILCYSSNSKAPDDWSPDKKSSSCVLCDYAKQNIGIGIACGQRKKIVILTERFPQTPFLLNLSVTSIISLKNYINDLSAQLRLAGKLKGPNDIAPLQIFVTKLTFKQRDHTSKPAAYPILEFTYKQTLPKEQWKQISDLAISEDVKKLIKIDDVSLATHREPTGTLDIKPAVSMPAPAQVPVQTPTPAPVQQPPVQQPVPAVLQPNTPLQQTNVFGSPPIQPVEDSQMSAQQAAQLQLDKHLMGIQSNNSNGGFVI